MNKELCRAWVDYGLHCHYINAEGGHMWRRREVNQRHHLDDAAKADGLLIEWPDGPGVATLVPIPDLWGDARRAMDAIRDHGYTVATSDRDSSASMRRLDHVVGALASLLEAHDRGEL